MSASNIQYQGRDWRVKLQNDSQTRLCLQFTGCSRDGSNSKNKCHTLRCSTTNQTSSIDKDQLLARKNKSQTKTNLFNPKSAAVSFLICGLLLNCCHMTHNYTAVLNESPKREGKCNKDHFYH